MSTLPIYTLTFNCGRLPLNPQHFAPHLFSALPPQNPAPSILVISLQELAPIAYSFLGGSYLTPYLSPIQHAVSLAGAALNDASYDNIITRNVGMTAIMVFVLRELTSQVQWLESAGVGVGMQEMGNKGAVGVRMGWAVGDMVVELSFVSAHLAPMENGLQRRNEDWKNIVRGLVFTPISPKRKRKTLQQSFSQDTEPLLPPTEDPDTKNFDESSPPGIYHPTTHLFLAGDLNYRTSTTKPSPTSHLSWPQRTTDFSSPTHFSHLLSSDQLTPNRLANRTLHGLQEAPIDFPPTYKYSEKGRANAWNSSDDAPESWLWSQHRFPSWCDRILYLDMPAWMPDDHISVNGYTALPLLQTSDHRAVACAFEIPAKGIREPKRGEVEEGMEREDVRLVPPFERDRLWRARRERARVLEVVVGVGAYLGLTWEGRVLLVAVLVGGLGGWWVVGSLVEW